MGAPRGTYTYWRWPTEAAGADSLAWDLTVLRDPGPTTYFWAHQWSFERGDVGYFGLQAHDLRDDGSTGRLAVFSVWSAVGCADNPGCHAGVEGAPFWTCRLAYDWVAGRAYRLRVARSDRGWWSASVTDRATGSPTLVGSIRVPRRWGGLDLAARGSSTWTEFYGANLPGGLAGPELVPRAAVRFGAPGANDWAVRPSAHANQLGQGDWNNSRVADAAPGDADGVTHEMGIPFT